MAVAAGTKVGPYELTEAIGAGGMGEVYRARDSRLGREVAIKVLPQSYSRDPERLRRFEQEARAVAALNHPCIVGLYDTGVHEGIPYLVSELLEGETLRERLKQGPLTPRRAVEYGLQIAQGLAAAHDKGVVHRDLKPENLFLTTDGRVKILDFGLAKLGRTDGHLDVTALGDTAVATQTSAGVVLGTVGYMSPEQVRAETVDHRSDIFSFGTILYEMVSGKRAFQGASSVETMNAVLKEEPPELTESGLQVSPGLARIVRHCMEKNPNERFQSARDLSFALSALSGTDSSAARAVVAQRKRWPLWVAVAALLVAVAALATYWLARPQAAAARQQFAIPMQGEVSHLALSPDGRMLAFVSPDDASGANVLYVQGVGSGESRMLPGTEGASYPFWSPDDAYVGFFAEGKLKKVAISGGVPQPLAMATFGRGGTWSTSGVIVYAPEAAGGLWRINADGSDVRPLGDELQPEEQSHRWPVMLPDGEHFLCFGGNFIERMDEHNGIYLGSLNRKELKFLAAARSSVGYGGGAVFYVDARGSLVYARLDVAAGKLVGEPRVAAGSVASSPSTYWGAFTVANDGTVVFNSSTGASLSVLTWYDRSGKELGRVGEAGILANPTISPDGSRVVVDANDLRARNIDLWIDNLTQATTSRFTFDSGEETTGVWSRDGSLIAFRSGETGTPLTIKKANGLEPKKRVLSQGNGRDDMMPNSWSADDKEILCAYQAVTGGSRLVVASLAERKLRPFDTGSGSATNGQISPDGKWVAFASNESRDWEIYVTTFPGAAGKWQVSRGGGAEPRWSPDGKQIYYLGPKGVLTTVPVSTVGSFSTGVPQPLFQIRSRAPISTTDLFTYDVSRDGKRFLVNRYLKPEHAPPLQIVLHATSSF